MGIIKMEAYSGFAQVYDNFMEDVPYEEWGEYLIGLLKKYGIEGGLVLDLGCGTGNITIQLASGGYDMIGVDNSQEMLGIAMEKEETARYGILYLNQDMRMFELYGTVRAIVSICDSMNYITNREELEQVFRLVNNYLDPSGLFIFDLNMPYKYQQIGDSVIAENQEECSFIWENYYDSEERINEYDLTVFARDEQGKYDKWEEIHFQRAYTLEEIKESLKKAGLVFVDAFDAFTYNPVHEKSERIYVLAREQGK